MKSARSFTMCDGPRIDLMDALSAIDLRHHSTIHVVVHHCAARPPIASRSAITSEGMCSVAALRFSRRCLTDDVPGMSRMFGAAIETHSAWTLDLVGASGRRC